MAALARALDFSHPRTAARGQPGVDNPSSGCRRCGACTIPQVDKPGYRREVLQAARYAPLGMRGMAGLGLTRISKGPRIYPRK